MKKVLIAAILLVAVTKLHAQVSIINSSGANLDIAGGNKEAGANVQLWKSNGTTAQTFTIIDAGNGYKYIKNVNSGKVLDISGGNDAKGTNIQQYELNKSVAQQFKIVAAEEAEEVGGLVYIISKNGYYLSSDTFHGKPGSNVFLWEKNDMAKWRIHQPMEGHVN